MVSLISTWWVKAEFANHMQPALNKLVAMVKESEEDTLMYLVHSQRYDFPVVAEGETHWVSEPMPRPGTLFFVEKYRSWDAFIRHTKGEAFNTFFDANRDKFVQGHDCKPFEQTVFMDEKIAFFREE